MFNFLKKVLEAMCQPFVVGMGFAVLGFILFQTRRYAKAGRYALTLGLLVLLVFGYSRVPGKLRQSLVGRYEPMTSEVLRAIPVGTGDVVWIAVLCGGYSTNCPSSVGVRLNEETLLRFFEGLRLYRELPNAKVLLSVGDLSEVSIQERFADHLSATVGMPRQNLRLITGATCTQDEAGLIRETVGTGPFVLVTSDYHMPRAMMLFKALGLNPVPAPAGQCGRREGRSKSSMGSYFVGRYFPSSLNLATSDVALHEYLGMVWVKFQRLLVRRQGAVNSEQ